MVQFSRFVILLVLIAFLLVACDLLNGGVASEVTPSPAATISVPATALPQATAELPSAPPPLPSDQISSLRLWIPADIGARTQAGADELLSQIRAYETSQNNLVIPIEQKPVDGPGGVINYLQTGQVVAPSIMPDIVAIPTSLLADARYRDLFYPLNPFFDSSILDDIYPAPAAQVVSGDQVLGYPFATIGLTNLIYDPAVITETISVSWPQFISDTNHTLVLPADSREGAMLGLQFYLAEGGLLTDASGKAILEQEPLARALSIIGTKKENLLQSHQLKTVDEAWQYHQLGLSDFMWMRSEYLLGRQEIDPSLLETLDYAAVPGVNSPLTPLTMSWAWAITTDDPSRQVLAADLIAYLTTPENLASWSSRNQVLPARRDALLLLAGENPYLHFADTEMVSARPMPVSETSRLMDVMGDAVFQVLTTETSPTLIAEQAAAALRQ